MVPVILQLLGIVVIIAEFLIPSAGILSVISIGLLTYSIYLVFSDVSAAAGFIFLAADLVAIPVLVIIGLKMIGRSGASLKTALSSEGGVSSKLVVLDQFIGKEGVAVSHLRPAGVVQVEGKRLDAVTKGEFIDKNSTIVVSATTANQLVVRKKAL
jgi:membrane-bound serine protease (ClpP class)